MSPMRLVRAARQHALDHAPLEPRRAARLAEKPPSCMAAIASRNAGIGRGRQSGLLVERAEAGAAPVVHQARDARERHVGEFGQRLLEHRDIARQQRAQDRARRSIARFARRCRTNGAPRSTARSAASVTVAFSQASLATRWARSSSSQSRATTKSGERLATVWRPAPDASPPADRRAPAATSRIAARWPMRATMRSSENGAISALPVLDQHQAGFGDADFGDRRGDRARQVCAARDRGLQSAAARSRRASTRSASISSGECSSTERRDFRLVGGERDG